MICKKALETKYFSYTFPTKKQAIMCLTVLLGAPFSKSQLELDKFFLRCYLITMNIEDIRKVAVPACREFNVSRLDAFGSAARGSSTSSSDVDLLVEFREPARSPAKRFFGLLHTLEDSLGCEVDLLTPNSLRNPYFKARVLQERISVYEE